MKSPKISVVIGTYNRRHCLGRTVDSVLAQTYRDRELIVVDDASTDGTADWLKETYPSITVVERRVNGGVASARNMGLKQASGEFVAFLDSDDWWNPDFLERQQRELTLHPEAVLSYCDCAPMNPDGSAFVMPRPQPVADTPPAELILFHQPILAPSAVLFRADRVRAVGGFREKILNAEDSDLYLRLVNSGTFIHVPETLTMKTRSPDSKSNNHAKWSFHRTVILDDFFAREENAEHRWMESRARSRMHAVIALAALRDGGDRALVLRLAVAALLADPAFAVRYLLHRLFRRTTRRLR